MMYVAEKLKQRLPGINVVLDEPMKNHTSFRIGGNADIFVSPSGEEEIIESIKFFKENGVSITVIGNGSNLLVSDKGIEGAVISIGKNFSDIRCEVDTIYSQSGALLSRIANVALENKLAGFEFASGIPGTLGGAIVMNAGAYGGEMKDVVVSTRFLTPNGQVEECFADEHCFAYRKSRFKNGEIILSSVIKLKHSTYDSIKEEMRSLNERRKEKQPLEYPSAGSTFKRPEGYFAAKLIDDAGLRGYRVGGACVSQKHCGFVINHNNATCDDVKKLMAHIQNTVKEKFGVDLEPEVRIIGRK